MCDSTTTPANATLFWSMLQVPQPNTFVRAAWIKSQAARDDGCTGGQVWHVHREGLGEPSLSEILITIRWERPWLRSKMLAVESGAGATPECRPAPKGVRGVVLEKSFRSAGKDLVS